MRVNDVDYFHTSTIDFVENKAISDVCKLEYFSRILSFIIEIRDGCQCFRAFQLFCCSP